MLGHLTVLQIQVARRNTHMARCFSLELSKEELDVLSSVVDSSLNVQPALTEPDRDKAVEAL